MSTAVKPVGLIVGDYMQRYDLCRILKDEIGNGPCDLVTRPSGRAIRERIEGDIAGERDGEVVALDFAKIGTIDYSCADEIAAKLISRLLGGEYGDKYIVFTGLNDSQRENIEVALERKDLAAVARMRDGTGALLGNLNNYLKETFHFVSKRNRITAKELSEAMEIEANTSGTRLLNLHKKRLVKRLDKATNGGRVWIYERI